MGVPAPANQVKKVLQLADGRDKALKIVQYLFKVLLWAQWITKQRHPQAHARISAVASQFSTTRKILRLAHAVEPYIELRDLVQDGPLPAWQYLTNTKLGIGARVMHVLAFVNAAVGIVNDLVDDTICLAKIGALDKSWAKRLDLTSSRLWMTSIIIDLLDNYRGMRKMINDLREKRMKLRSAQHLFDDSKSNQRREIEDQIRALRQKLWIQRVSFCKLLADFAFCWVDVNQLSSSRADGTQAIAGLVAALLASYKIWVKCS